MVSRLTLKKVTKKNLVKRGALTNILSYDFSPLVNYSSKPINVGVLYSGYAVEITIDNKTPQTCQSTGPLHWSLPL